VSRLGTRPRTLSGPARIPPQIDIHKPSAARVYDAVLGGKDNFAWDRAVAKRAMTVFPGCRTSAAMNRQTLGRAVRYMSARGIDQFLDLGSGLPTAQNTHEIAQAVNPAARVVYVDNDPIVLVHGRALLAENPQTTVVTADIRRPDTILTSPTVLGFLDFSRPIGLILNAVIHHVNDDENPRAIVTAFKCALAPGSYLQLTHFSDAAPEAAALEQVLMQAIGSGRMRGRQEFTSFFDGLELVGPGVVFAPEWRPDTTVRYPLESCAKLLLSGMGRKPAPKTSHHQGT
jgi:hypothetical protein